MKPDQEELLMAKASEIHASHREIVELFCDTFFTVQEKPTVSEIRELFRICQLRLKTETDGSVTVQIELRPEECVKIEEQPFEKL
jgi:hypothetical protein